MSTSAPRRPYRFTTEAYFRMGEAGIIGEDERVELLDGEILEMSPIGTPHSGTVSRLIRLWSRVVGDRALVRVVGRGGMVSPRSFAGVEWGAEEILGSAS